MPIFLGSQLSQESFSSAFCYSSILASWSLLSSVIKRSIIEPMNIDEIKVKINPILKKYGVKSASIFGSVARGENKSDSDIDMIVAIEKNIGVYEFVALKHELEDMLGKEVDLVSRGSINKYIGPYIEKDIVNIYEGL